MNKKALAWGGLFGFITPFIGLFLGLQVSVTLGNIFAFPVIAIAYLLDTPFGEWHPILMAFAFALSTIIWAGIFGLIAKFVFVKKETV